MADYGPRTYLRDANGPRVIASPRTQVHSSRYGRESEDRTYSSRSRRTGDKSTRTKHDNAKHRSGRLPERPTFRLDVIGQPARTIALGMEVSTSVLVSLAFSSPDSVTSDVNLDPCRLMGMVSVVAETRTGERVPMEADAIVAEQLVGSLRPIPREHAERVLRAQPCRLPLGFLSFPNLVIRQAGQYRVRVSLLHMPGAGHSPTTIAALDTELIKVVRGVQQQQQRRPRH